MASSRFLRVGFWKPRYSIGGLMATIAAIALLLTAMRPLAGILAGASPELATTIRDWSTPEFGIILTCLAIGGFTVVKLLSLDEHA